MTTESPPDRYRRRHRWPILAFIAVMMVGTGVIWFQILKPGPVAATGCNTPGPAPTSATPTTRSTLSSAAASQSRGTSTGSSRRSTTSPRSAVGSSGSPAKPASALASSRSTAAAAPRTTSAATVTTTLGQFVTAAATLTNIRPADPATLALQVFNASKTRGQAKTLTKDLQSAGFASIKNAANDVLYPAADLICESEIRFGQAGLSQARTVLIVAPCAQLVVDDRIDGSVDLALGARYNYVQITDAMKQQLAAIHDAAAPLAVIEGQTAAPRPLASIPPLPVVNCTPAVTTSQ